VQKSAAANGVALLLVFDAHSAVTVAASSVVGVLGASSPASSLVLVSGTETSAPPSGVAVLPLEEPVDASVVVVPLEEPVEVPVPAPVVAPDAEPVAAPVDASGVEPDVLPEADPEPDPVVEPEDPLELLLLQAAARIPNATPNPNPLSAFIFLPSMS
jgi:hypothetical protein